MAGCQSNTGEPKNLTLKLEDFQLSEGEYQFTPLPFGGKEEDAEKAMGVSFEKVDSTKNILQPDNREVLSYTVSGVYSYEGIPIQAILEYTDGKFSGVSFYFQAESIDAMAPLEETIIADFKERFGDPTNSMENADTDTSVFTWDTSSQAPTRLQINISKGNPAYFIMYITRLPA